MLILIVFAYLFGSVPFGIIIAKMHSVDLRSIGSGNIGATNVSRALGRKWAYTCFALDVLKGMIPTLLALFLVNPACVQSHANHIIMLWLWLAIGCAAVIGHIFPIYLGFKGGKGVSTSFGVALGLWPYYTICAAAAIIVWVVVAMVWRYVSLASIAGSIAFLITLILAVTLIPTWNISTLWPLLVVAVIIPLMVIIRHRQNINRLLAGAESKITKKNRKSK